MYIPIQLIIRGYFKIFHLVDVWFCRAIELQRELSRVDNKYKAKQDLFQIYYRSFVGICKGP